MEALILAGGKAERLGEAAQGKPKPLVPVAGRPLVAHTIDRLAAAGVDARDRRVRGWAGGAVRDRSRRAGRRDRRGRRARAPRPRRRAPFRRRPPERGRSRAGDERRRAARSRLRRAARPPSRTRRRGDGRGRAGQLAVRRRRARRGGPDPRLPRGASNSITGSTPASTCSARRRSDGCPRRATTR